MIYVGKARDLAKKAKAKGAGHEHGTSEYRVESRAGECETLRDDGHTEQERKGTSMA